MNCDSPEPGVAASAKLSAGKAKDGNSSLSSSSQPIFQLPNRPNKRSHSKAAETARRSCA